MNYTVQILEKGSNIYYEVSQYDDGWTVSLPCGGGIAESIDEAFERAKATLEKIKKTDDHGIISWNY